MEHINILVVEDEKNISNVIKAYLEKEDYRVYQVYDGEEAINTFKKEEIHLVILDLMIPKISGEEVCSYIRNISSVPIIMLTAKSYEQDKIHGLSIGADDYVVKPFSPRELVSRVQALLRRSYRDSGLLAEILIFDNNRIKIDTKLLQVTVNDEVVDLTANEYRVLLALANNPNGILSRDQIINIAFSHEYEGYDRTIDTHIKNIRQKIEADPKNPKYIMTVYGMGYKFQV